MGEKICDVCDEKKHDDYFSYCVCDNCVDGARIAKLDHELTWASRKPKWYLPYEEWCNSRESK